MATITSTIKLVDQMTPTLNKISKAIDRVNSSSKSVGSAKTWSGFNAGVQTATRHTNNLYNALRRAVFIVGSLKGLQGLSSIADTMMNTNARINNINDGLYTTSQYMDMIYQSAQRARADFATMAQSVSKLGTLAGHAFGSMGEVVGFTELMNKLFVISGSSAAESSNAMYQLTQAMAAGKLQGDEMRSILENAPMLAQKIAEKMNVPIGKLKELGAKGEITAEIIKDALFESADDIEKRFEKMPKTIGQVWTEIKNHAVNTFRPVIDRIQKIINSAGFNKLKTKVLGVIDSIADGVLRLISAFNSVRVQNAISQICDSLRVLWGVAKSIGEGVANIAIWIADRWSWIAPIIYIVVGALLLYKTAVFIASVMTFLFGSAATAGSLASLLLSAGLVKVAEGGALVMTTFGWIVLIILAFIAVIYLAVTALNHFTDSSVSVTGVILGLIAVIVACIWDALVFIWDLLCVLWDGIVLIVEWIWNIIVNLFDTICAGATNAILAIIGIIVTAVQFIIDVIGTIVAAVKLILSLIWELLCDICLTIWKPVWSAVEKILACFEWMEAGASYCFWNLVKWFLEAIAQMAEKCGIGVDDICQYFVDFYNSVCDILNKIADFWNETFGGLGAFEIKWPDWLGGGEWSFAGIPLMGKAQKLNTDSGIGSHNSLTNAVDGKIADAQSKMTAAESIITSSFEFHDWEANDYTSKWDTFVNDLDKTWNADDYSFWKDMAWVDMFDEWSTDDFTDPWEKFANEWDKTWNSEDYWNLGDAWNSGYETGTAIENGVAGFVDGIGGILENLLITGGDGFKDWDKAAYDSSGYNIADSLGDLLGGSGGGTLGNIADNTGKSADSTSNIEDTLDLAEEELQLLRKLAEQEVINRFTTAEIHVDMTNNNNISSKMDLDGIVTHLSNKLYEELGVVASGVHY